MAALAPNAPKTPIFKIKPGKWELQSQRNLEAAMREINEKLIPEIITNEHITTAVRGIYTWIIKGIKDSTFYATRVFTKQEIGTLHLDLDRQTTTMGDIRDIICAGELKVSPGETPLIQFNIQSGTFTKKVVDYQPKDISLIFPKDRKRESDNTPIWGLFFGTIDSTNSEVQEDMDTLFVEIQQDAWKIAREMLMSKLYFKKIIEFEAIIMVRAVLGLDKNKENEIKTKIKEMKTRPKNVEFSNDNILELLSKRTPPEIIPSKLSIKNRCIIYKRKRLTEFVTRMFCSFFGQPAPCTAVTFRKSKKSDDTFIKNGDVGKEFEVTAGKSLIVGAKKLTRANNIKQLSRYFSIRNNEPTSGNNAPTSGNHNVTRKRKASANKSNNLGE